MDSGLPHDDITPRSESLSTASSASPPDQSQHGHHHNPQSHSQLSREMQQQHRKSTSLDDINLNGGKSQIHTCFLFLNVVARFLALVTTMVTKVDHGN